MSITQKIQAILGLEPDGVWGPKSQSALIAADAETKKSIQVILGVAADGIWGPVSQAALNVEAHGDEDGSNLTWFSCNASSFADPADLVAFKKCKATGKSDKFCFGKGDNGIGQFGKITAQEWTAMIAVNAETMKARWGSVNGAAHRPVQVAVKGITINATVEDRISTPGRIDLNPACARLLNLRPPFVVKCQWRWA